ncbi:hypothetical protein FA10DRAFT_288236 [Acaromyces ingoldii]|uniref:DUF202 domain-containing protein n=1 Tax=Acaromyces ingoldii TaxID=215250 RepID=A0A316YGQ2_9BASI|nr:hypothetical protein FA10DRAFT_288236 [Acaromyces ingoldii]PWN88710.1 hypothetical protein FA10DRAFT_288236 [Acaromyces ingoldii]
MSSDQTAAANTLADRGTLSSAYRRSMHALQTTFGWSGSSNGAEYERQPLLQDEQQQQLGQNQAGTSYGSVLDLPPERRVPKPKAVKSPVRVEAKVWFANERTWISWLRVSLLIGSFALAMYNSANFFSSHHHHDDAGRAKGPQPSTIRNFSLVYAGISILTLVWGLFNYHRRLHLIRTKYAGDFDDLIGPPLICLALFVAVLLNFITRVQQYNAEHDG